MEQYEIALRLIILSLAILFAFHRSAFSIPFSRWAQSWNFFLFVLLVRSLFVCKSIKSLNWIRCLLYFEYLFRFFARTLLTYLQAVSGRRNSRRDWKSARKPNRANGEEQNGNFSADKYSSLLFRLEIRFYSYSSHFRHYNCILSFIKTDPD